LDYGLGDQEFYACHIRPITLALADFDDPGVSTITSRELGSDLIKKLLQDDAVADAPRGHPAGVQVTALPEGDQFLGHGAEHTRAGTSRDDRMRAEQ
jgi:hypothetical protein